MTTYNTDVYLETGGAKLVVASGGEIEVQSGGTLDMQGSQTFIDDVAIILGTGSDCSLEWDTAQTQDCLQLGLGASRTLMILEKADMSADKALAAGTYPQVIIYDSDADNYMTLGSSGDDIALVGSSNDLDIRCGLVATDALNLQAYDVGAGAYEDMITLASHATLPTMVLHATGGTTINAGLTLSDAAGTGAAVVGCVAGQDLTITSGDDMLLRTGPLAADVVKIQAYDVGVTTYEDIITASAHATLPTLVLHATGGTTINSGLTLSDAAGTGASVVGCVAGQDITVTAGNDMLLQSGPVAADVVKIQAYDVGITTYEDIITASAHATLPTLVLHATGGTTINSGLTLSDAAGTGASVVGCVAGQDLTVTAGNDMLLQSGPVAADVVKIQAYDVGITTYEDIITASAHATLPTLVLHATGGTTINSALVLSDAAGTGPSVIGAVAGQDITITSGDDLVLQSGPLAADLVTIGVYDVGAVGYETVLSAAAHATLPTLTLAASGGITMNLGDNLATGLDIQEAANDYITCVTTDDFEEVEFGVPVDMELGRKVSTYFEIFDDFVYQTIAETDTPWILNSGTDTEAVDPAINAQENGVIRLVTGDSTGATAADASQLVCHIPMQANNGGLVFETRLNIDSAITNVAINAGFTDSTALEEPFTIAAGTYTSNATDAAVLVYDTSATTDEWHMCAVDSGTDDTGCAATGTAPVADVFDLLRIEVSSDGATIKYFINGTLEGTLSGDAGVSPSTNLYATVVACGDGAASKTVDVDYVWCGVTRG